MTCIHLRQLYQLCQDNQIRITSSDLVRVVCKECGVQEVCPAVLTDEYEAQHPDDDAAPQAATPQTSTAPTE